MSEVHICLLRRVLLAGRRVAWVFDGQFGEIRGIVFVNDEERAMFADGSGRYVDLFNASPEHFVLFEDVFGGS